MEKVMNKKDRERLHKSNAYYDKYMAGKYNQEEGEYNYVLSSTKKTQLPNLKSNTVECKCGNIISTSMSTKSLICGKCNNFISI